MKDVPNEISLEIARKIINGMIKFANDNKLLPGSYAVVDAGGHVVAFERRDMGLPATGDIAIDKAWTAATMMSSGKMLEVITMGQGWRLNVKHKGRLTIIPGTIPLISHNKVIGGVGHSGGSADDDEKISQAGMSAMYREDKIEVEVEEALTISRNIALESIKYVENKKLKPVVVSTVDKYGWINLIYRMDGANYGLLEIARDRAWTAAAFGIPSDKVLDIIGDDAKINWNERLNTSAGGIPYILKNKISGAIGIAGNTPSEDKKIAEAALKKIK
ncbi:MAG: GlcG/HbpS family heme-binding protein [Thermoplasmata archaeon]|jgi:uncharacterized protein GlcG (DUF336 family)|uniref:GlcG/HbpS family heme-binding protein n=1 Tax=Caldisericum sp. TaxID=2499687 RepID=UPI003C83C0D0